MATCTTKKGLFAKGNGFEIDSKGMTVCDAEVGLASFSVKTKHANIEILDCLTASATASLDWSGIPSVDISANASIYSPCVDFVLPLGIFTANISAEAFIGVVGVGIELDPNSGKFKITPPTLGIGSSFSVDFDLIW